MPEQTKKEHHVEPITWRAAEREFTEKTMGWYVVAGIVALTLVVAALVVKNFLFALFLVLAVVVLILTTRRRPRVVEFRIDESGIRMGNIGWPYDQIESFTFHTRPGRLDHLVLRRKVAFNPFVHIPIDDRLAVKAKTALAARLPEFEYQESLIDTLADWFGV